jgi:Spy/CpxP family protein refolding chaperone
MKRTIIIGMLLTSVSAFAFSGHRGAQNLMLDELNLTPAQQKQLKTIRKESRGERIKLMDQMDDLRDSTRERILSVLTDKQKTQFLSLRKEMRQSFQKERSNRATMNGMNPNCGR